MPYEYRRLTPEERAKVLRQRKGRGYPLHSPPHPYRGEHCYLISAANYDHMPIMASSDRRTEFEHRLLLALDTVHVDVIAWVVLPNHYHALVNVESLSSVSAALQHAHGGTSRGWNLADGLAGRRTIWLRFTDSAIRNDSHFIASLNYIHRWCSARRTQARLAPSGAISHDKTPATQHYNPVKHRYVDDAYDWPWSSVESYLESQGRDWLRAQWLANPPGDMGRGWDD